MAARRGVVLEERHRDQVAAGELTIAQLADSLQISRQAVHAGFRKRQWSTTSFSGKVSGGVEALAGAQRPLGARQAGKARKQPPAADRALAPAAGPSAAVLALAPASQPLTVEEVDLATLARGLAADVALRSLARCQSLLESGVIGAGGLRSVMQAAAAAVSELERLGVSVVDDAGTEPPTMKIMEFTADELQHIQDDAERSHHGLERHADDDDADDDASTTPRAV